MASARLSGAWQATWISKETAPAETVDVIFPLFFLLCIGFQVYSDPSKCRNLFELLKLVALYKRICASHCPCTVAFYSDHLCCCHPPRAPRTHPHLREDPSAPDAADTLAHARPSRRWSTSSKLIDMIYCRMRSALIRLKLFHASRLYDRCRSWDFPFVLFQSSVI